MTSLDAELHELLFDDPRKPLVDFKIIRGTSEIIDVEDLKRELVRSLRGMADGLIAESGPPRSKVPPVDVREWVGTL